MSRWVVTGANRGIGLELARQLVARGDDVVASARVLGNAAALAALAKANPTKLRVAACDVRDDASVRAFAAVVGDAPLHGLFNNAGVMGKMQSLEELDTDDMVATFDTNALGPIRVTRALLPQLASAKSARVVHISSGMGSIGDNQSGGAYGYRMSKAALNMASRSMSVDLRERGVISVVMNPGWVKTDMGGRGAPTPVEESVSLMLGVVDALTPADSGAFLNYRGGRYEW